MRMKKVKHVPTPAPLPCLETKMYIIRLYIVREKSEYLINNLLDDRCDLVEVNATCSKSLHNELIANCYMNIK